VPELPSTSSLVVISGLVPLSEGSGLGVVVCERVGSESFGKRTSIGAGDKAGRFRTRELQEGLPARDDIATIGVLPKERERGVRQASVP